MEYLIRNAEEKDLEAIHQIEKECFSLPWTVEQLRSQLRDTSHDFLVAVTGKGNVLGYIGMMSVLDEGYISNVAVSPVVRCRGIGRALVKELLDRAAERKLSFVTLEVREHNENAIRLYSSEGFLPVGTRTDYYERPRENALLMTRFFIQKDTDE